MSQAPAHGWQLTGLVTTAWSWLPAALLVTQDHLPSLQTLLPEPPREVPHLSLPQTAAAPGAPSAAHPHQLVSGRDLGGKEQGKPMPQQGDVWGTLWATSL